MNKLNLRKGFTLIELLVVVAIISLLSSIVFASLTSARFKGADAATKQNLINARSQAELFYYSNGNKYSSLLGNNFGGTDDVCSENATGSATGGVKGVYPFLVAAKNASGAVDIRSRDGYVDIDPASVNCSTSNNGSAWAADAPLKKGGMFCVDSTGKAKEEASTLNLDGPYFCQ